MHGDISRGETKQTQNCTYVYHTGHTLIVPYMATHTHTEVQYKHGQTEHGDMSVHMLNNNLSATHTHTKHAWKHNFKWITMRAPQPAFICQSSAVSSKYTVTLERACCHIQSYSQAQKIWLFCFVRDLHNVLPLTNVCVCVCEREREREGRERKNSRFSTILLHDSHLLQCGLTTVTQLNGPL